MDSNKHNNRIPQLRFPGFERAWEEKTQLGDVIDVCKGQQVNNSELTKDSSLFPMLNGGTSFSGYYSKYNTPANTITISEGGNSCGFVNRIKQAFWAGGHCYIVKPIIDINEDFLFHLLKQKESEIMKLRVGSGLPNIQRKTLLAEISLSFPKSPSEQRQIAECLNVEDQMISAQEQKVESLKAHKKGLMQQLFPQPGETTPRLRFPGFPGEWEEKPLSHFLHEHKTKSDGKCEVHSVSVTKGVINQVEYLGRSFAASDTSKYNLAKPGDIIYTKSPTGSFPYGIVKQNKNPYNVIVSPLYAVYTPLNQYVGYLLDSYFESPVNTNNYLSSLIQKGAKNTIQISNDTFVSKSMFLPSNPAEQQKIAECLESLDSLIASETKKLESLKTHKRGLMQQLFPQPNK